MTLVGLMVHNVTVVHPGIIINGYGDVTKDWLSATRTDVKGWVARRSQVENHDDGREAEVAVWVVYLPAGTTITGGDRVEWADMPEVIFEVDGPPNPARSPRGAHHIEADLRTVEG